MRRDPFAMLPFIGYNMSDYFQHWLDLGAKLQARGATLPKIFCVNWFRKGADGKFVWPGYGENMRVLRVDRRPRRRQRRGRAERLRHDARATSDLDWSGLDFDRGPLRPGHRASTPPAWSGELALHDELFEQLAHHLPDELPRGAPADRGAPRRLTPTRSAAMAMLRLGAAVAPAAAPPRPRT